MPSFPHVAVVTVATRNYQYRARLLMRQVAEHLPGALRISLQSDPDAAPPARGEPFLKVDASTLGVPRYDQLAFALDPAGLCCALKPWAMLDALSRPGIERVLYLDNDISLYRRPDEWLALLDRHSVVLTPHFLRPLPEGASPSEFDTFAPGAYNAGMIGVARHPETTAFLRWWRERLSIPAHLYYSAYDQPWLGYVPSFFPGSGLLRDPGYNVAYWNLSERRLEHRDGSFFAGGAPLTAFHFSYLDENAPRRLVSDAHACPEAENPVALRLARERVASLHGEGRDACLALGYAFARLDSGETITSFQRQVVGEKHWDALPDGLRLFSVSELGKIPGLPGELLLAKRPLRQRLLNRLSKVSRALRGQ